MKDIDTLSTDTIITQEDIMYAKIILNKKGKKVTSKVDTLLNNLTKEQGSSVKDKIKKGLNK